MRGVSRLYPMWHLECNFPFCLIMSVIERGIFISYIRLPLLEEAK